MGQFPILGSRTQGKEGKKGNLLPWGSLGNAKPSILLLQPLPSGIPGALVHI